jgi:hypothetical protein
VLSDEILKAVDDVVGRRGRSRFIEDAAREKLERLALADELRATHGIARGRAYEHWQDRSSAVAWVRGTRSTETSA